MMAAALLSVTVLPYVFIGAVTATSLWAGQKREAKRDAERRQRSQRYGRW